MEHSILEEVLDALGLLQSTRFVRLVGRAMATGLLTFLAPEVCLSFMSLFGRTRLYFMLPANLTLHHAPSSSGFYKDSVYDRSIAKKCQSQAS